MRSYEIEIGDFTWNIKATSMHTALREAMLSLEKKLKDGGYRSKVGENFRIEIERKE
jgi:hypothetical protein